MDFKKLNLVYRHTIEVALRFNFTNFSKKQLIQQRRIYGLRTRIDQ